MIPNGFSDFTGFTGLNLDYFFHGNSGVADNHFAVSDVENKTDFHLRNHECAGPSNLDTLWYLQPPEVGNQSQPYRGVEVLGEPHGLSHLRDPLTAPTTLYPQNLDDGTYIPGFWLQPATNPPSTAPTTPPIPTIFHGPRSPSASRTTTTSALDLNTMGQVLLSDKECQPPVEIHEPDPLGLFATDSVSFDPHPDAATPGVILPAPVIPSSGPQRTSRRKKGNRKYDPVDPIETRNDVYEDEHKDGWDVTFVRFRAKLHDIVFSGQPPGGLSPETALPAKIMKLIKEELKRSPLQNTVAGEGKRARNVEGYLINILREIDPALAADLGGSQENATRVGFFKRVANVLEAKLVAVNQSSALQPPWGAPRFKVGKAARLEQKGVQVHKNQHEKLKREEERFHLERMSYLFKVAAPEKVWTRAGVLSLAVVFLLWGPDAFTPGFVRVSPGL